MAWLTIFRRLAWLWALLGPPPGQSPSAATSTTTSLLAPLTVRVPAGAFVMGATDGDSDERPPHKVTLHAFEIDRDEVSVRDYARCVAAGRCEAPRRPGPDPTVAVTFVRWTDAASYCAFVGERLPTEAEWERAARGPKGSRYPFGDEPDCARANFGNYRGEGRCEKNPGHPTAPGLRPGGESAEGARDLAGNVWEWVADRYDSTYYARSPMVDPRGPDAGERRVLRGGACCSMFLLPRSANRLAFPPGYDDEDIGFRCARDAAPPTEAARARLP